MNISKYLNHYFSKFLSFLKQRHINSTSEINQSQTWNMIISRWPRNNKNYKNVIKSIKFNKFNLQCHEKEVIRLNISMNNFTIMKMSNNIQNLTGKVHS